MSSTAYLIYNIAWDADKADLPDNVVVHIPNWFCLAELDTQITRVNTDD